MKQAKFEEKKIRRTRFLKLLEAGVYSSVNLECPEGLLETLVKTQGLPNNEVDHSQHSYETSVIVQPDFPATAAPFFGFDSDTMAVFFQNVNKEQSREDLTVVFSQFEGSLEHLSQAS